MGMVRQVWGWDQKPGVNGILSHLIDILWVCPPRRPSCYQDAALKQLPR